MAQFATPVKLQRGTGADHEVREAGNDTTLVALEWDGFVRVEETPTLTEEQLAALSPAEKGAITKERTAAEKAADATEVTTTDATGAVVPVSEATSITVTAAKVGRYGAKSAGSDAS